MYRPLPPYLTIKPSEYLSKITGKEELGLFATEDILLPKFIGTTHILHPTTKEWIRTPLGGFYNHNADNPNIEIVRKFDNMLMYSLHHIKAGEELTAKYQLYDPTE